MEITTEQLKTLYNRAEQFSIAKFGRSFESARMRFIKKPKVCVTYSIQEMGSNKKPYMDWVDADNCIFEIVKQDI